MTPSQSALMTMANAICCNWCDSALEVTLQTIDLHLPFRLHKSKYRFFKSVPNPDAVKYYYAPECFCPLTFQPQSNVAICGCDKQGTHYKKKLDKTGSYFYHLPLKQQLRKLFQSGVFHNIRREDSAESDVISGDLYKDLVNRGIINGNTITLQLNTDGVIQYIEGIIMADSSFN